MRDLRVLEEERGRYGDESEHRGQFYEDDAGVEICRFLDTDNENDGDGDDRQERE